MSKIYRHSLRYHYGRYWVKFTFRKIFYRRFEIRGKEKFHWKDPIIFAPNHQNAAMDALIFVTILRQQPIFLSRADIFVNPLIRSLLKLFKMLPVWRIRDGFRSVPQNEETFEKCAEVLGHHKTLILFPEGNHDDKRRIRPLKKGLARIAFEAEETYDFKLGLKVIPVGIDYSDYEKVRGRVTVSYGDPIRVADLESEYKKDPQIAYRELNKRITEGIKPHMIHIPWEDIYDTVMSLRTIFGRTFRKMKGLPGKTLFNKFDADKKMIDMIGRIKEAEPELMDQINVKVQKYNKLLKLLELRDHVPEKAPYRPMRMIRETALMVLGFPLLAISFISNFHLIKFPDYVSRNWFKDPQFKATVAYVLSLPIMFPLFYALQTLAVWLIFKSWIITVAYFVTLLPGAIYTLHYYFWFKKWRARLRFNRMMRRQNPAALEMITLRNEIVEAMKELTNKYLPTTNA